MHALQGVVALTFDVFGTVVDWHGTVSREMAERALRSKDEVFEGMSAEGKDCAKGPLICRTELSLSQTGRVLQKNGEEAI